MVAIFTGAGAGFQRGSANILGAAGQIGSSLLGRASASVSVNAANGNLLISQQDEFLVGLGPDVGISRSYNSLQDAADGDNGDHWQQSTTRRVFGLTGTLNSAGSTISRLSGDGSVIVYGWDAARSAYVTSQGDGAFDTLTQSAGVWTWTDGDSQITETYESYGTDNWRITARSDQDGNSLAFTYNGDKLDKVTTADGGWTQYVWSGNNIAEVVTGYTDLSTSTSETLTRVRYTYDGSNRLTAAITDLSPEDSSVLDGETYSVTYTYDGASNRVASIAQSDGSLLSITYDSSGRVKTLTQAVASGVTRTTTLTYGSGYTQINAPNNQNTRLDYDSAGRLTKITAPPATTGATAQQVVFGYDTDGNVVSVTDGNGKVTHYDHDTNGNVTLVTDANGDTVQRTYDAANRLITELAYGSDETGASAAHYMQYAYDSEGHLRFTVDAAGRVAEYEYTAAGQLLRTILYPEHRHNTGPTTIDEAGMESWVAGLGSLASVQITENAYDARGNLVSTTAYSAADAAGAPLPGAGTTKLYNTYDQAGRLLERHGEGQNSETFVYDGLGRMVASSNALGGTATFVFDDANLQTIVTSEAGYVTTQTYNRAGEMVAETGTGRFDYTYSKAYQYDSLGRLRIYTDANNYSSYAVYDKAGRKVADVNHLGEITEYRYDAANRIVATIVHANAVSSAALTTLANPNNTAQLSSLLPASSADDVWSWNVYDDGGRLVQEIDNLGATVVHEYDHSGQLVGTTAFARTLSSAQLAAIRANLPTSQILPPSDPQDVVIRQFYNAAGQVVGRLDGEGYLTETVYDAAGQAVESWAYATPTVESDRDGDFATMRDYVAVTSLANRVSRSVYDGQGLLRFTIDAKGGVTGFEYDAAGRVIRSTAYASQLDLSAITDFGFAAIDSAVVPAAGDRTSWTVYDESGQAAFQIDGGGGVTAYTYDVEGRVIKSVAYANFFVPSGTPDLAAMESWAGNAAQLNDPQNRVNLNFYGAGGRLRFTVDAENYATYYDYDLNFRLVGEYRVGTAVNVTEATAIEAVGDQVFPQITGDGYIPTNYGYDSAGRLIATADGEGFITQNVYNHLGQVTDVYRAYGTPKEVRTHYKYDGVGRVVEQVSAYGTAEQTTVKFAYDGLGNQIQTTDGRGSATNYAYDLLGRLVKVTDALYGETKYEYDSFGNVLKVTDPNGASSFSYYDTLNRVIATRDAEGYVSRMIYNRFGEQITSIRYSIAMTDPGEAGIAYFDPADVPPDTSDPFVYAAQLQVIADGLDSIADDAESTAADAAQDAIDAAQAASDADDLVTDIEDQIAAFGSGPIDFEDARTAALADMNAWLLARSNWLTAARTDAQSLRLGKSGLEREELDSFYGLFDREQGVADDLKRLSNTTAHNEQKAAYINQYYDNLTWQANNLELDRSTALANPLAWLQDRRADLESWTNSVSLLTGSFWTSYVKTELQDLWSDVVSAIYDLDHNTYSTSWPSSNNQINNWYNSVQSNSSYVPNNINSTSQQTSDYRAAIIINAFFDVFEVVDYEQSELQSLQIQLSQAEQDAVTAHAADDAAQLTANTTAANALDARADAEAAQDAADVALAAAQSGTAQYYLDNSVLIDLATLGRSAKTYYYYDNLGRTSQKIDAGGYVETYSYNAFGQLFETSSYALGVYESGGSGLPPEVIQAYEDAQQLQGDANSLYAQAQAKADQAVEAQGDLPQFNADAALADQNVTDGLNLITSLSAQIQANPVYQSFASPLGALHNERDYAYQQYQQAQDYISNNPTSDPYWYDFYDLSIYFANEVSGIDAEISSVQAGHTLSMQGRVWVEHAEGFSAGQVGNFNNLQTSYNQAVDNLPFLQSAATTAHAAVSNQQNTINSLQSQAATLTTQADAKQIEADQAFAAAVALEVSLTGGDVPLPEFELSELGAEAHTQFQYDNRGQLTRSTDAMQFYQTYKYDAYGRRTEARAKSSTAATVDGGITKYKYDKRGLLTSETLPIQSHNSSGGTVGPIINTYAYDERGNLIARVEAEGLAEERTTEFEYDLFDRLVLTRHEAVSGAAIDAASKALSTVSGNPVEKVEYDANGNVISTTDASGAITTFIYDELNRKTGEVDALGALTTYAYDAAGNVTRVRQYEQRLMRVQNSTGQEFSLIPNDPDGVAATVYRIYDIALGRFPTMHEVADWVWKFINLYPDAPSALMGICQMFVGNAEFQARLDPNNNTLFVTQMYRIAFHRDPTQAEINTWVSALNSGTSRAYVFSVFINHPDHKAITDPAFRNIYTFEDSLSVFQTSTGKEFWTRPVNLDNSTAKIFRLYDLALGRFPTQDEVRFWLSRMVNLYGNTATSFESISSDILGDVTVQGRLDPNDNTKFLTQLYRYTFHRDPEQAELDTWSYALTHGTTRGYILSVFVDQPGHRDFTDPLIASIIHDRIYVGAYDSTACRETTFQYDDLGRLVSSSVSGTTTGELGLNGWVAETGNLVTHYQYDYQGNAVRVIDPNGNATVSSYDARGRKTGQIDAEGYRTDWVYDSNGNVLTETRYATQGAVPPYNGTFLSPTSDATNDRVTQFTYDLNGNRTSETRMNVKVHDGNGGYLTQNSTISYLYNGLGQVVRKTEATGDQTDYGYDAGGRLISETREGFTSYNGQSVTPEADYFYDGLGNLVRLSELGGGGTGALATTYQYGADGRLSSMTDAAGNTRGYLYDLAGRLVLESYDRTVTSTSGATSTAHEAVGYRYDKLGRSLGQAIYAKPGSSWQFQSANDYTTIAYTTYGQVAAVATNRDYAAIGSKGWQQQNQYDGAGRLIASNAGDGLWKYFGYDKSGNQTIAISSGGANLSGKTFSQALGMVGQTDVNATYVKYDKRNLAYEVVEEDRELSTTSTVDLTTSRTYTAFGDVASETDALGYTVDYAYNTMGRLIEKKSPQVQVWDEHGSSSLQRPTERYYYDASGRMVAQKDANGNLTTLNLIAGTGYDGSDALVSQVNQAGGGIVKTGYDIHGNARKIIDQIDRVTNQTFDGMGRVLTVSRQGAVEQNYAYDQLGHQVKHWNNWFGSSDAEITTYDIQGRVVGSREYGGEVTTTSYAWNDTSATSAIGNYGGWTASVHTDGYDRTSATDLFGRTAGSDFTYDAAGRLTLDQTDPNILGEISYEYYNTGNIKLRNETGSVIDVVLPEPYPLYDMAGKTTWYSYDELGRLKTEKLSHQYGKNRFLDENFLPPGEVAHWEGFGLGQLFEDATATYDALGRLSSLHDNYGNLDKNWSYDANGNVRKIDTTYHEFAGRDQFVFTGHNVVEWYRYDQLNRVTLSKGELSGGNIVRGADGIEMTYDAASRRMTSQTGSSGKEYYSYNDLDLVTQVRIGSPSGNPRVVNSYDVLGRLEGHLEYDASGNLAYERFDIVYNSRNQVLSEKGKVKQGADWIYNHTINFYNDTGHPNSGTAPHQIADVDSVGSSTGNLLEYSRTKYGTLSGSGGALTYGSSSDNAITDTADSYQYEYHEDRGFLQSLIQSTNQWGVGSTVNRYDGQGNLVDADRYGQAYGWKENVYFASDAYGQVVDRLEYDDNEPWVDNYLPRTHTYRFGGREIGVISNDGTDNVDYSTLIDHRDDTGAGDFRYGASGGTNYADFDANHVTMASGAQDDSASSYMVRGGETLQSIALAVWGDANLWYKLAEANGVSGGSLQAGQRLIIPNGVVGIHNNADTIRPYDPNGAMGDISPPHAVPPKPTDSHGGCGFFGQLLVAAVSFAVTALAPISGGWVAQIANGLLGNIAGQAVGVATGVQDGFSFKSLALTGISAGVGVGLGKAGVLQSSATSASGKFVDGLVQGAVGNAVAQGIGVATGLQKNFNWAGVAAAGVGNGVGYALGGGLKPLTGEGSSQSVGNIVGNVGLGIVKSIASAATRSAIEGSSFGDNILAGLPDVIGNALGQAAVGRIQGARDPVNLIPDAFYDEGPVQRPGNEVSENPVSHAPTSKGESIAESVASQSAPSSVSTTNNGSVNYMGEIVVRPDPFLHNMIRRMTEFQFWDVFYPIAGDNSPLQYSRDVARYALNAKDPLIDTLNMSLPQAISTNRADVGGWALSKGSTSPWGGYMTNVQNYQRPAIAQIDQSHRQWDDGSYVRSVTNNVLGQIGYYGAYLTGGYAAGTSLAREGSTYANPRDLKDGAFLEFVTSFETGVLSSPRSVFGAGARISVTGNPFGVESGALLAAESNVWRLGPGPRGEALEQMFGHNLPGNFPTIDRFENGVGTSIKSVDLDATSYLSGSGLRTTLTRYVDKVAGFNGTNWAGTIIRPNQIAGRSLEVIVPHGGNAVQQATLADIVKYGSTKNVTVKVIPVPWIR